MKKFRLWLVIGLLALGLIGLQVIIQRRLNPLPPSPVVRANPATKRTLSDFEALPQTDLLMARISSAREGGFGISSGKGYSHDLHNFVFANPANLQTWKLLPTNDWLILSQEEWPPKPEHQQPEKPPVPSEKNRRLYFLIKADTNQDGQLSYPDSQVLAIANGDGTGLVEILPNIDHLYWKAVDETGVLVCIYRSQGKRRLVRIDVLTKHILQESELNVDADVE